MKVGIITFHQADNYGAVLQAFALQEAIKNLGEEAYILDYHNEIIGSQGFSLRDFLKNPIAFLYRFLNGFFQVRARHKKFELFRAHYMHIQKLPSQIANSDFDCFVLGSDQIWNPSLTGGIDPVYWGSKDVFGEKRVVTYAASSGKIELFNRYSKGQIKDFLSNISFITVRESRLKDYLQATFNISSTLVVDPTILHNVDFYNQLAVAPPLDYPYVLYYNVEGTPYALNIARKVAHDKQCKLVSLSNSSIVQSLKNKDIVYFNATVPQMLALVKYSQAVVALSFHGTLFSLFFHKEFYSVSGGNMARVEAVLSKTGFLNRIVSNEDFCVSPILSFEESDKALSEMKRRSLDILKEELVY